MNEHPPSNITTENAIVVFRGWGMPEADCRRHSRLAVAAFAAGLFAAVWGAPATAAAQTDDRVRVPPELLARAAALDPNERIGAVESLAALRTPAASSLLDVMLARDVDARVRYAAANALGLGMNPDMIPSLERAAATDPDPDVRAAASSAANTLAPFGRRPTFAAGLSVLCPGCGYLYLRQFGRAGAYVGTGAALLGATLLIEDNTPPDADGDTGGRAAPFATALQGLWMYGIFASYRDARLARGNDAYARYPVAREGLADLAIAPFNPRVLKSPYVWAGIPAALLAAIGYLALVSQFVDLDSDDSGVPMRTLGDPGGVTFFGRRFSTGAGFALGEAYHASRFVSVAGGEEALFRGVIQAGLSEALGQWGGWAAGSAIFGAFHVFNFVGDENGFRTAAIAVPYITLTGSYLGYVFMKKNFSLLHSTAVHFWYDFALATIGFIADPDGQPFVARVALPF
jgi:membrane protease YdiL (CAAX protease family)